MGCTPMKRYLMQDLVDWKNDAERKPMILKGARQVGKTWLMCEFGRQYYKKTAYISFFNNKRLAKVFDDDWDLERLLMNLGLEAKTEITAGDTLIILDEIQACPRALEALKFFCEAAPEYHIIAAGSLLGIAIHEGISFPVGKVNMLDLSPMNFCEFLEAQGQEKLAELINNKNYKLLGDIHEQCIFWLKNYYFTGGIPAAVKCFAKNKNYQSVRKIQNAILEQYENDFGKHIKTRIAKTRLIWHSIPVQLAKENKKFFFGQVKQGARMRDFDESIEWLCDCGLAKKVYKVSKPAVPLKAYAELNCFKLFMFDTGLLGALSELEAQTILEGSAIFTEFKGALTEQFVLQELTSQNKYKPYYYVSESNKYEIDFIIQKDNNVVPVEVKAGSSLQAKSLKYYREKFQPCAAVRISMAEYKKESGLLNLPLYAVSML